MVAAPLSPYTHGMRMTLVEPSPALAPYVRRFTLVETDEDATRVLLPEPGVVVAFRYAGHALLVEPDGAMTLPDFAVTGLRTKARRMCTSRGGGVVIVVFRETGAAPFFDGPLHELLGQITGLDAFAPSSELARVAEGLAAASEARTRVEVVERFLLARKRARSPDRLVQLAVGALRASNGSRRVGELARELGVGVDRLEKRFRQAVGASPKQLGSLYRLQRAVELHRSGRNLIESAFEAGYADQPHFNRRFRAAIGVAPRSFLEANEYCGSGPNANDEWLTLAARVSIRR